METFSWESLGGKAILVLVVLVVAMALSFVLQYPVKRLLDASERRKTGGTIFQNIVRVLVWGWALCSILDIAFGFDMAGVLGALGIVGVAVSLGGQQTIANVIGGVIVSLSSNVGPDDWITIKGHKEARVVDTNWRHTTLIDEDGIESIVPNAVMVSEVVEKGNPYFMFVVPFSLKPTTPDIEGFLVECEQVVLDRQVQKGHDYEQKRPKAHVEGTSLGVMQAEMKIYANRAHDTRFVKRDVTPALIGFLQERDALPELDVRTLAS